jgi:hypothetical protein
LHGTDEPDLGGDRRDLALDRRHQSSRGERAHRATPGASPRGQIAVLDDDLKAVLAHDGARDLARSR